MTPNITAQNITTSNITTSNITTRNITIVGLGPAAIEDLTLAGRQALHEARHVVVRTRRHPCLAQIPNSAAWESCDDLYERHAAFADVYQAIVARVFERAQTHGDVVYAVPGHPAVGEITTRWIQQRAADVGIHVRVIGASSFIEPAFAAVGVDPMDGSQVVDAMLLARQHHPKLETGLPLLVAQVYSRHVASELKLTLLNAYPAQHPVSLIEAAGAAVQTVRHIPLHELDHGEHFTLLTTLYVPPLPPQHSVSDLQEIVAHLRAPEGCPWDRQQTLASMRHDLLSECSEVLEAVDADDGSPASTQAICEELGDLMLAATLMVQIASDEERFRMADAMHSVVSKLIRRHPHVFGDVQVDGVEKVLANWDAIKAQEKADKGISAVHPLDGVPAALPALEKARVLQSKAHKAGLLARQELAQANAPLVQAAHAAGAGKIDEESIGKLLWQTVALAHEHGVNAEDALRAYSVRFRQQQER